MFRIICTIVIALFISSCTRPTNIDNIYNKCFDKRENSVLNFMLQFKLLAVPHHQMVDSVKRYTEKPDEFVNLCECFATKFANLEPDIQNQTLKNINTIDHTVNKELKIFEKRGVLGNISQRQVYATIESHLPNLDIVNRLLGEAIYDKFERKACLSTIN